MPALGTCRTHRTTHPQTRLCNEWRAIWEEEERQLMLLALAELTLSRPGFDDALGRISDNLQGRETFVEFKRLNADRPKEARKQVMLEAANFVEGCCVHGKVNANALRAFAALTAEKT